MEDFAKYVASNSDFTVEEIREDFNFERVLEDHPHLWRVLARLCVETHIYTIDALFDDESEMIVEALNYPRFVQAYISNENLQDFFRQYVDFEENTIILSRAVPLRQGIVFTTPRGRRLSYNMHGHEGIEIDYQRGDGGFPLSQQDSFAVFLFGFEGAEYEDENMDTFHDDNFYFDFDNFTLPPRYYKGLNPRRTFETTEEFVNCVVALCE